MAFGGHGALAVHRLGLFCSALRNLRLWVLGLLVFGQCFCALPLFEVFLSFCGPAPVALVALASLRFCGLECRRRVPLDSVSLLHALSWLSLIWSCLHLLYQM